MYLNFCLSNVLNTSMKNPGKFQGKYDWLFCFYLSIRIHSTQHRKSWGRWDPFWVIYVDTQMIDRLCFTYPLWFEFVSKMIYQKIHPLRSHDNMLEPFSFWGLQEVIIMQGEKKMGIWGYKERKTSCETGFTTPVVNQGFHQLKTS